MHGRFWEIPVTIPYEIPLHRGFRAADLLSFWKEKIQWIQNAGGLILVNTHPEPGYLGDAGVRSAYMDLLRYLSGRSEAWYALPREIVRHLDACRSS